MHRVAEAARTLARGTRPEPVPVEGASELATLALAFNDLAEQLTRAQEAERSFLLSVSHELKTPLTAIRGWTEALAEGAVDVQDAAETVAAEAARLERLVQDLLDLARMNRTDFSVHPSDVDLGEVAADAVRRYQQQAAAFGVWLTRSPTGRRRRSPTPTARSRSCRTSSRTRFGSTPRGGEVRVITAPRAAPRRGHGPGPPAGGARPRVRAVLPPRALRPRAARRHRPRLAIVKELTEAMGGRVEVVSEPGRLTAFTVMLPTAVPGPVAATRRRCDEMLTPDDVQRARVQLAGRVHRTPTLSSASLGADLKAELFQKTGSFKVRGVLNRVLALTPDERRRGVVTWSAGNHAQAVAWACAQEGVDCLVSMWQSASPLKVEATRGYGATVDTSSPDPASRTSAPSRSRSARAASSSIPTATRSSSPATAPSRSRSSRTSPTLATIVVGVGGGGLIAGIVTAVDGRARVVAVEPEGSRAFAAGLEAGHSVRVESSTIADGLAPPFAGELPLRSAAERSIPSS